MNRVRKRRLVYDVACCITHPTIMYSKFGFAVAQGVPEDAHAAYESLLAAGSTSRLLKP
ncbi:hypothetical protein GCM10010517_56350 [Streptosporangium fragile]|uniref:Uncharacterized protein n=1 Tax=Streptosporangium fragile TaxID=46186 RepID=A0ABP6IK90_9ACTN